MQGMLRLRLAQLVGLVLLTMSQIGSVATVITQVGAQATNLDGPQEGGPGTAPIGLADSELGVAATVHVQNLPPSVSIQAARIGPRLARVAVNPSDPNTPHDIRYVQIRVCEPNGCSHLLRIDFCRGQILGARCDLPASELGPSGITFELKLDQEGCYTVESTVGDESQAAFSWIQIHH